MEGMKKNSSDKNGGNEKEFFRRIQEKQWQKIKKKMKRQGGNLLGVCMS
jgi:hypothetical protein